MAAELGISQATVSRILRRLGLNKLSALEPAEPGRRYERERPGEMIHIDIRKLGRFNNIGHRITGDRRGQSNRRGVGWEYVHICIDDASRIAFAKVIPNEKKRSAIAFLAALAYYADLAVQHRQRGGHRLHRLYLSQTDLPHVMNSGAIGRFPHSVRRLTAIDPFYQNQIAPLAHQRRLRQGFYGGHQLYIVSSARICRMTL